MQTAWLPKLYLHAFIRRLFLGISSISLTHSLHVSLSLLLLLLIGQQIDQATKRLTERRVDRRSHRHQHHRIASDRHVSYTWLNKMYGEILAWRRGSSSSSGVGEGFVGLSFGFSGFILGALMRFACIWSHSVDAYQRVSINCGDAY